METIIEPLAEIKSSELERSIIVLKPGFAKVVKRR